MVWAIGLPLMLAMSASCTKSSTEDEVSKYSSEQKTFMENTEYGVYPSKGTSTVFAYTDSQMAYNLTALKSRMQRDDLSAYVQYVLGAAPIQDGKVQTTISSQGVSITNKSGEFKVLKKTAPRLWLWDDTKKVGHLIYWE